MKLELRGITKAFGPVVANRDIDLVVERGEVHALLGENGAGKSTLVSILFGHYVADEGQVEAFGRPLPPGRDVALVSSGDAGIYAMATLVFELVEREGRWEVTEVGGAPPINRPVDDPDDEPPARPAPAAPPRTSPPAAAGAGRTSPTPNP